MKNKVFVYLMKQESCAIKSPGELDVSIIFLQIFKFKFVSSSDKVGRFVTNQRKKMQIIHFLKFRSLNSRIFYVQ